jgi:translation initiation factor IF-2
MSKIRVQDLATMMGISQQDLVFKLRSIGVRVEGDEAGVDSEILQAILQGKKMNSPREVIMDDAPPAAAARRPGAPAPAAPAAPAGTARNPLRPVRPRTIIQKVEPRIKTLPTLERPASEPGLESLPPSPAAVAPRPVAVEAPLAPPPIAAAPAAPSPAAPTAAPAASATPAATPAPPRRGAVLIHRPTEPYRPTPPPNRGRPGGPPRPGAPGARPPYGGGPGARPGGYGAPGSRPPYGGGPARPGGPRPPGGRPGGPPGSRGPGPTPLPASAPGRGDRRAQPSGDLDKKKTKKGRKTVTSPTDTADIRNLRTLEQIEEVVDQSVVPSGSLGRRRRRPDEREDEAPSMKPTRTAEDGPITISEGMTVREFAERLGVKVKDLLALLFRRGILANINHVIEPELGVKLAEQFGFEAKVMTFEEEVQATAKKQEQDLPEESAAGATVPRAPVVTIMGHVDHGKTSLLDQIRKSKIVDTEFGGITQHIGAYHVDVGNRQIVFLDTPGHEAFTLMRARGAKVTDVVILVVAADDGVMPQTLEAIDHARAAGVPILVALNKIDKANANPDRVKQQLSEKGLMAEDWGGQTVVVPVSALKGEGINELLEMVLLTSDLLELKANPDRQAQGVVLEARKETGRGVVATVLVHNGTLKVGDVFVSGSTWGRVRSMTDDRGRRAQQTGPATAVEVTGFDDVPEAGDSFQVVGDEQKARGIVEFRQQEARKRDLLPQAGKLSLEQLFSRIETGEIKDLGVVLKADVQGSVEVLREAIEKLGTAKVKVSVLHSGVGAISTNDVLLASASKAIIVGFNVRPERNAVELAEKEQVEIRLHTIIYELLDELKLAMVGLLEPLFKEVARGRAEVREIFKVPKIGTIAGCHVVDGVIPRTAGVRVVRDGRVVFEGKIASLKRFKDDASEVRAGFDCGIGLERFQDVKPGDVIEAYVKEEVAPTLA